MKFVFTLLLLLACCVGFSQNDVLKFTDYGVAQPLINPACMGLEPGVGGLLLYRSRFEKAEFWPSTGAFNVNSMIKDKNLGGGITLLFDKYGPYQKVIAYVAGSYKLKINEGKFLYFGLQAGINYVTNAGGYVLNDTEETIFSENYSQPNFGFGLHYQSEKFYAGVSLPELKYNTVDEQGDKVNEFVSEMVKFFAYGGYRFKLTESTKLEPYTYVSYSEYSGVQMDLGGKLRFKETLEVGVQYRTKESFALMARVRLLDELWVGYSFEGNNSTVDNSFNSVQEISLTFRFGGKKGKKSTDPLNDMYDDSINSIRYF